MTRKKKPSRKYIPRNEFRYNRMDTARGHLQFIFGETRSRKLKALGLTHNADDRAPKIKLQSNPNPNDSAPAYVRKKVVTTHKKAFSATQGGFAFSPEDRAVVRHLTKQYKKSTNRHPPGYYEAKKRKKK